MEPAMRKGVKDGQWEVNGVTPLGLKEYKCHGMVVNGQRRTADTEINLVGTTPGIRQTIEWTGMNGSTVEFH